MTKKLEKWHVWNGAGNLPDKVRAVRDISGAYFDNRNGGINAYAVQIFCACAPYKISIYTLGEQVESKRTKK